MHSDAIAPATGAYPGAPGPMGRSTAARNRPSGRFTRPAGPGAAGSASRQARDVLVQTLAEQGAELVGHAEEVARLADEVARRLGLSPEERVEIRLAAELHDVGKVAVPDGILNKPAPLNRAERLAVELHPCIGERIIAAAPALAGVATVVRSSHERVDGKGYPDRLEGNDVPIGARVIAACDAYDAMVSDRPYRRAMAPGAAREELKRHAGSQFDPVVVRVVCELTARSEARG